MQLQGLSEIEVVGVGGDVGALVGGDDIEAVASEEGVEGGDVAGGGVVHEDHVLQRMALSVVYELLLQQALLLCLP